MKKFKIKFKHTVEEYLTAIIEAEDLEEAKEIFEDETFDHLESDEPYDTQGLGVEIIETKEV